MFGDRPCSSLHPPEHRDRKRNQHKSHRGDCPRQPNDTPLNAIGLHANPTKETCELRSSARHAPLVWANSGKRIMVDICEQLLDRFLQIGRSGLRGAFLAFGIAERRRGKTCARFTHNAKLSDCRRKGKVEREQRVRIATQGRADRRGGSSPPASCSPLVVGKPYQLSVFSHLLPFDNSMLPNSECG